MKLLHWPENLKFTIFCTVRWIFSHLYSLLKRKKLLFPLGDKTSGFNIKVVAYLFLTYLKYLDCIEQWTHRYFCKF